MKVRKICDFNLMSVSYFKHCCCFDLFNIGVHHLDNDLLNIMFEKHKNKSITKKEYISLFKLQQLRNHLKLFAICLESAEYFCRNFDSIKGGFSNDK